MPQASTTVSLQAGSDACLQRRGGKVADAFVDDGNETKSSWDEEGEGEMSVSDG